jgi:uncharacterized protein YciI
VKMPAKSRARTLLSEFSGDVGSETLKVRFYRDRGTFVCEREIVERDGTSFTMVIPFREADAARKLVAADPYYSRVRWQAARALRKFDQALSGRQ